MTEIGRIGAKTQANCMLSTRDTFQIQGFKQVESEVIEMMCHVHRNQKRAGATVLMSGQTDSDKNCDFIE